jgi:hypothetical protein
MHCQTHPVPCTVQIAFVLLARSGAPGGIRTPGLLVRRKAVNNSKCCFWCRLQRTLRAIYLGLELDRSWTEMTVVNPLDGTNYLDTASAFTIVRVKSKSLRVMIAQLTDFGH